MSATPIIMMGFDLAWACALFVMLSQFLYVKYADACCI